MATAKSYLGEGVYVRYDGYHVVLTAEDGDRVSNRIFLDSDVLYSLECYLSALKKELADNKRYAASIVKAS